MNMGKIGLIVKREYIQRVSKKSFLLLTFLAPILFAALVFVPLWLSSIKGNEVKKVAVLDSVGKYASHFKDTEDIQFVPAEGDMETYRADEEREIYAFLSIGADLLEHPDAAILYSEKQIPMSMKKEVNDQIARILRDEKMASFHIPNLKEIIQESDITFDIRTVKWEADGSQNATSAEVVSIAGFLLTFLIYIFITSYGSMVMQGVMEEKTNRIIELMVSSVRPFDLMIGKVIGIGMVGLTQFVLWGILTFVLVTGTLFLFGGDAGTAELMQEDSSQFMTPMLLLMVFALYAGIYSVDNPDGPLAFWCSWIPFTSPIVMMVRLPYDIPLWQNLLSLAILYGTAFGCIWISGKIYRIGILMYGKKPGLMEILRWIHYRG